LSPSDLKLALDSETMGVTNVAGFRWIL
jgi:hypothetical protein